MLVVASTSTVIQQSLSLFPFSSTDQDLAKIRTKLEYLAALAGPGVPLANFCYATVYGVLGVICRVCVVLYLL